MKEESELPPFRFATPEQMAHRKTCKHQHLEWETLPIPAVTCYDCKTKMIFYPEDLLLLFRLKISGLPWAGMQLKEIISSEPCEQGGYHVTLHIQHFGAE